MGPISMRHVNTYQVLLLAPHVESPPNFTSFLQGSGIRLVRRIPKQQYTTQAVFMLCWKPYGEKKNDTFSCKSKHSMILIHIPNLQLHMKWKLVLFSCASATSESQNTFVLTIAKCWQDMKRLKGNAVSWCARLCIAVVHVSMVTLLRDTLY